MSSQNAYIQLGGRERKCTPAFARYGTVYLHQLIDWYCETESTAVTGQMYCQSLWLFLLVQLGIYLPPFVCKVFFFQSRLGNTSFVRNVFLISVLALTGRFNLQIFKFNKRKSAVMMGFVKSIFDKTTFNLLPR